MPALPFFGELSPYWLGVLGSLCVEIAAAARSSSDLDGRCPDRYKRPAFLIIRALLAFIGGGSLAVVLDASNAVTAFWLGASAPIVLDRLGRGASPNEVLTGKS